MAMAAKEKIFKKDCPRYISRADAEQYGKALALPGIPDDPGMFWCGDKRAWISGCERPCAEYVFLTNHLNALRP